MIRILKKYEGYLIVSDGPVTSTIYVNRNDLDELEDEIYRIKKTDFIVKGIKFIEKRIYKQ